MSDWHTFITKRDAALRVLADKGIRWRAAPPIYWVYWACGFRIPPPLFAGFVSNIFYQGMIAATFVVPGLLYIGWNGALMGASPPLIVLVALAISALGGLLGAVEFRYIVRKHKLPAWSDLRNDAEAQVFE